MVLTAVFGILVMMLVGLVIIHVTLNILILQMVTILFIYMIDMVTVVSVQVYMNRVLVHI